MVGPGSASLSISTSIGPLVSVIGTPTLVFSTLVKTHMAPDAIVAASAATVAAVIGFLLVGTVILRLAGLSIRTYLSALAFPNTGNLGLPWRSTLSARSGWAMPSCSSRSPAS